MPIVFVSLNGEFITEMLKLGYTAYKTTVQDFHKKYVSSFDRTHKLYYMSPANSLGFMDGGFDKALSQDLFPNLEKRVKTQIQHPQTGIGKVNKIGQKYLPIGSSFIDTESHVIICPTMLLPQDISKTNNVYYAVISCLYNLFTNNKQQFKDTTLVITSCGCGYGKMTPKQSAKQIQKAIQDFKNKEILLLKNQTPNNTTIIWEPNLEEQPNTYENTTFKHIEPNNIQYS